MLPNTETLPEQGMPMSMLPPMAELMPEDQMVPMPAGKIIRGYIWRFGEADMVQDEIMPGAIARSLAGREPESVRMLFQHDPTEIVGTWIRIEESPEGVFVEGEINMEVQRGRELAALIETKSVDGLSVGFQTKRARRDVTSGNRQIFELDLWEVSIVAFPMLSSARLMQPML